MQIKLVLLNVRCHHEEVKAPHYRATYSFLWFNFQENYEVIMAWKAHACFVS